MSSSQDRASFWDHLGELRAAVLRTLALTVVCGIVAFVFKDVLFGIVLAPADPGFATYGLLSAVGAWGGDTTSVGDFSVRLINTGLARQFVVHMKAALCAGALCASPYAVYQIFRFVSPALYADERRYVVRVAGWGYVMFMAGVLVSYFLIFPLTFRFLGTYQVSADIENMISLDFYMSTLAVMSLALGIVFEIPVVAWLFAKLGFVTAAFLRRYRKHAIVAILVVAAVIIPTSDVFTLSIVALPMWLLYEASIIIIR